MDCRPVTEIMRATGLEQPNVSFHLRILRESGFVRAERRGPFVHYCLAQPDFLDRLREFEQWLKSRQVTAMGKDHHAGCLAKRSSATRQPREQT